MKLANWYISKLFQMPYMFTSDKNCDTDTEQVLLGRTFMRLKCS